VGDDATLKLLLAGDAIADEDCDDGSTTALYAAASLGQLESLALLRPSCMCGLIANLANAREGAVRGGYMPAIQFMVSRECDAAMAAAATSRNDLPLLQY